MIINELRKPQRPQQLVILQLLKNRMQLSEQHQRKIEQLRSGYEGEKKFYNFLKEKIDKSTLILNDLLLSYEDALFQIDSLIIIRNNIYLFEVKNYRGEYFVEEEKWYKVKSRSEIRNPFLQISRTRFMFDKLLQSQNLHFSILPYLIFVNEDFTLYNAPMNEKLILPTQISGFLNNLSNYSFKYENYHKKLLDFLNNNSIIQPESLNLPEYSFQNLKKGTMCWKCGRPLVRYSRKTITCRFCQIKIVNEVGIVKSIEEFNILFPNTNITTSLIFEWCGHLFTKKTIWRTLKKYYKKIGSNKSAYYVTDKNNANNKDIIIHEETDFNPTK